MLDDAWLPRIQVITARSVPNSTEGLFLAAKGGHNAESHNHNDVGSFIVYADGYPLFLDPGVGTYRKETFNDATRYHIWCMQSGFHNLPQINGKDQKNGQKYTASDVKAIVKRSNVSFSLDIAGAYPEDAEVSSWIRDINFKRNKSITVTETYSLKSFVAPTDIMFMTQAEPFVTDDRIVFHLKGGQYALLFDKNVVTPSFEKMALEDQKFVDTWGELYRIKLTVKSQQLNGEIKYVIKKL